MKKVMTEKHRYIAYILNVNFGYNQKDIAELMDIKQSTISSAIVKVKNAERNMDHYNLIKEARKELEKEGFKDETRYLYPTPKLIERMNRTREKRKKEKENE